MEEEDKKVELNSEIWKKYEKKEAKNLKKNETLLREDLQVKDLEIGRMMKKLQN